MNKKQLTGTLAFLGVKTLKELLGKTMRVSYLEWDEYPGGNSMYGECYFLIHTVTKESSEINFPPVAIGQGGQSIQVSIFGPNDFHIALRDESTKSQAGYFHSTRKDFIDCMTKGDIEIL